MTQFDTSRKNVYLVAFAKALLSLLTNPSKYKQASFMRCLIGQMENLLPAGTPNNFPEDLAAGLGISHKDLSKIYDASVGNHLLRRRSRARFAVVNALNIVLEGKPLTGVIGLLALVRFLLTRPSFKYNQDITGNGQTDTGCLFFIFAGLRDGTGVPKRFTNVYFQIQHELESAGSKLMNRLYTAHSMPRDLQKRYDSARSQRTKNFVGAVRILRFIANEE